MTTERSVPARRLRRIALVAVMVAGLSMGSYGIAQAGDYGDGGGDEHKGKHHDSDDSDDDSGDSHDKRADVKPGETHHHLIYAPTYVGLNLCGNSYNDAGSSDNPSYGNTCVNNAPEDNLPPGTTRKNVLELPTDLHN